MIKGVESLLHNSRFTSAQHVADNRTTADVRLHNSCCAADDTISFDNYSYLFRQLFLSFPTTYPISYDNLSYLFQQLFLSFQTANHSISKFYLFFFPLFFLILRIIVYLCDVNQTIMGDNKNILFLLT